MMIPNLSAPDAPILVVGDVMLDAYWSGQTGRISPEAPVPIVAVQQQEQRTGGAANVALNIAALGGQVTLMALRQRDEAGLKLEQLLEHTLHCQWLDSSTPTITKLRILSRHQQLLRLDFETPSTATDSAALLSAASAQLPQVKVLVLSDYAKGALQHPQALIQAARQARVPVLIDPKGNSFEQYCGATLLTPNMAEFEAVVGRCTSDEELVAKGLALCERLALGALLVTRSEKGMSLIEPGQPPLHLPAKTQEVYDVTGAGDTVIATLAAALAAQQPLAAACRLANVAAGIVVGKLGTSTVSAAELAEAIVQTQAHPPKGAVSLAQLRQLRAEAAARGERVIMTNGCFDLLHAGHVSYLAAAKALGDRLIVAVNSDASVQRLKGPTRPINPLADRMAVLAGLAAVDWVIAFEADTPAQLIEALSPDVLVKGGDYDVTTIVGAKHVLAQGGRVEVLPFVDNCSTSAMVAKIIAST